MNYKNFDQIIDELYTIMRYTYWDLGYKVPTNWSYLLKFYLDKLCGEQDYRSKLSELEIILYNIDTTYNEKFQLDIIYTIEYFRNYIKQLMNLYHEGDPKK